MSTVHNNTFSRTFTVYLIALLYTNSFSQIEGTYQSDSLAVRAILDHAGLKKFKVKDITEREGKGRVISIIFRTPLLHVLPPEIGQLRALQSLYIGENTLTKLPPEIGKLDSLEILNLRAGRLKQLPREIGRLTKLKSLSLFNNNLSQLPDSIVNLISLNELDLGRNKLCLSGDIEKWADRYDPDWKHSQDSSDCH